MSNGTMGLASNFGILGKMNAMLSGVANYAMVAGVSNDAMATGAPMTVNMPSPFFQRPEDDIYNPGTVGQPYATSGVLGG